MKNTITLTTLLTMCWLTVGCHSSSDKNMKKTSQIPIVNNFSGWSYYLQDDQAKQTDVWTIKEDILNCSGTSLGYLCTNDAYSDFTMTFQYRWPDDQMETPGKGGILIRTTGPDKIWPKSLEAQINAGDAGDFWALDGFYLNGPENRTKTLSHDKFGKLTNITKLNPAENPPGQWNSYEIIAKGPNVYILVNNRLVNKTTAAAAKPGKICITAEGTPIQFKDIIIFPH